MLFQMCCFKFASSYLAGSLWGRHSLELSSMEAPMSVGSLVRGTGGGSPEGVDCEKITENLIELEVQEGVLDIFNDSNFPFHPWDARIVAHCYFYSLTHFPPSTVHIKKTKEIKKHMDLLQSSETSNKNQIKTNRFPKQMNRFAHGMARVKKDELTGYFGALNIAQLFHV